jgi:hypothetical protein
MNWLVSYVIPFLVPIVVSQLKGGAAATWQGLLAGTPVQIASATVPSEGHFVLQLVKTA